MTLVADGMQSLTVDLGARSYPIHVGSGLIGRAGDLLQPILRGPQVVIITDENIAPHWSEKLEASLTSASLTCRTIILPAGEGTKDFKFLSQLLDDLLEHRIDRKTTLVALGGGVIGDLTGFAAAIALRGIDFVQIPTSLLAQVDSSVGGKTGIDTRHGKNLVGAFHQPRAVLIDTDTVATLPMRERLCGYAEVIKYGVINDRPFFDWLVANGHAVLAGDSACLTHAILHSCKAKAAIVAADEREAGMRALLNLGHTFGHALEAQIGFDETLKHGEAVAIGTVMAFSLAQKLGHAALKDAEAFSSHLQDIGLPRDLTGLCGDNWTSDALLTHMGRDKKTENGKLTFIVPRAIGSTYVAHDVAPEMVSTVLDDFISSAAK